MHILIRVKAYFSVPHSSDAESCGRSTLVDPAEAAEGGVVAPLQLLVSHGDDVGSIDTSARGLVYGYVI